MKLLARNPPPSDERPRRRPVADACPIGDVRWRHRARIAGRVRSVRVQPWGGVPTLECTVVDSTGGLAGSAPAARMLIA